MKRIAPEALSDNPSFYPTPPGLIAKMLAKIEGYPERILEPSAGKGDLIDALHKHYGSGWRNGCARDIFAIESDPTLQATLRGKGIKVLDSDFLSFAAPDKFDLVIANPPFADGDKHLLKALEILYRGQIIFLLNAETLRNPHTNTRRLLVRKLDEAGAKIQYIKDAFTVAERKTKVEVALISVKVDRKVEDDLFADCKDHGARAHQKVKSENAVSTGGGVEELVAEYNEVVRLGTDVIVNYFRNFRKIGKYLGLNSEAKDRSYSDDTLTGMLQAKLNDLLRDVRVDFWRRVLNQKEVYERLTAQKRTEFEHQLAERSHMDFTESNIRQFVLNIIGTYEQTLTEAVLDLFDTFTIRHSWNGKPEEKNIHYFNGWKTNKAFRVGEKVIVPFYGTPFFDWGRWKLGWDASNTLADFDKVMRFFSGDAAYVSLPKAIETAFARGVSSGESTYFGFRCHKKGTLHLTFRDPDILRRFNLVACRGKRWLPEDYGTKSWKTMDAEEKAVAESFEGRPSYEKHHKKALFAQPRLRLAA